VKPSKDPLAVTKRFVPTRFGRLNVGPWFGWWGYDQTKGPQFDTAYVGIAHISICPRNEFSQTTAPVQGFLFPQSYDQSYVDDTGKTQTIAGDFQDFFSQGQVPQPTKTPIFPIGPGPGPGPGPSPGPGPGPSPSSSSSLSPVAIALIVLGCLILVALAIAVPLLVSKHKKQLK
jgi:hypothetical protein